MDSDRIAGIGHQLKGAMVEGIGKALGDAKLEADGAAERRAGKLQNKTGSIKDTALEQ